MSFQDLEAGHVRGAPPGGGRRSGRGDLAGAGAGASQAVASGVFQINTAVATFQRLVNTLGTPKDTPDLRDRMCVRSPYLNPHLFWYCGFGPLCFWSACKITVCVSFPAVDASVPVASG